MHNLQKYGGEIVFYDNFIRLCAQRSVTPSAVMRAIGLNKSSATYWKKGSTPSSDTLQKLADYFGITVDDLLSEKRSLGVVVGGKIIAPEGIKTKYGVYAGGGIEAGGPVEIGLVVQGELARAVKSMEQMTEEGRSKVADYAEDILPRYSTETTPQPPPAPQEGTDTTPPQDGAEGPQEGE